VGSVKNVGDKKFPVLGKETPSRSKAAISHNLGITNDIWQENPR
jgi:hypothetical protein